MTHSVIGGEGRFMVRGLNVDDAVHKGARRRSTRYRLNAAVQVMSPVQTEGVALNMSAGGLCIVVPRSIPDDLECLLEVWLTPQRAHTEVARVVWSREHVDGWVIGMELVDREAMVEPEA
jgi:hypothetical protein